METKTVLKIQSLTFLNCIAQNVFQFFLYGNWLVAMTRILLIAAEMEQYIAIHLLT